MPTPRYRRRLLPVLLIPLLLVACNGGADDDQGGVSFCDSAKKLAVLQRGSSSASESAEGLADFVQKSVKVTADLANAAPDAVKADATTLSKGFKHIDSLLSEVDYDLSKLDSEGQQALSDPALAEATNNVSTYVTKECDVDLGPGGEEAPPTSVPAQNPEDGQ